MYILCEIKHFYKVIARINLLTFYTVMVPKRLQSSIIVCLQFKVVERPEKTSVALFKKFFIVFFVVVFSFLEKRQILFVLTKVQVFFNILASR